MTPGHEPTSADRQRRIDFDVLAPLCLMSLVASIIAIALGIAANSHDDSSTATAAAATATPASSSTMSPHMPGMAHDTSTRAKPTGPVQDGTIKTLEPKLLADGTKVFTLDARNVHMNMGDGKVVDGMGYNGSIPGPTIDVQEGDHVRVVFTNKLDEATTVHWHGIDVPSDADGVPGLTQAAIKPGKSFTYEFDASPAGTHFYHTHGSGTHGQEAGQMSAGLAGALIIHRRHEVKADIDMPIILGGGLQGMYTINGGVFPHVKPLYVKTGQLVRLRMINAGSSAIHPMHVHGHQVTLDALDGNLVPPGMRMLRNTITVNPGETADLLFRAYNPGKWVIHCHDLNHVSGGMVMPFIYTDYKPGAKIGTATVQ
jgi:FtsP/CotA-like multicopper oxidase with cupredoxin domain